MILASGARGPGFDSRSSHGKILACFIYGVLLKFKGKEKRRTIGGCGKKVGRKNSININNMNDGWHGFYFRKNN
ncbi:unspecified product [Plasmodium ovale curtisi]|uniref:Unspecified product n=1 Tax=Plasmodium ovale curtisi TaxID=864141 RepID=A0A1A8WZ71_PLAOA|nr:unspecified product [Plasmodium ovale curtisi]